MGLYLITCTFSESKKMDAYKIFMKKTVADDAQDCGKETKIIS